APPPVAVDTLPGASVYAWLKGSRWSSTLSVSADPVPWTVTLLSIWLRSWPTGLMLTVSVPPRLTITGSFRAVFSTLTVLDPTPGLTTITLIVERGRRITWPLMSMISSVPSLVSVMTSSGEGDWSPLTISTPLVVTKTVAGPASGMTYPLSAFDQHDWTRSSPIRSMHIWASPSSLSLAPPRSTAPLNDEPPGESVIPVSGRASVIVSATSCMRITVVASWAESGSDRDPTQA